MHDHRAMTVTFGYSEQDEIKYYLLVNGLDFNELPEATVRHEPLARSTTSINMQGHKKYGSFPLLRNGELIPVSV